MFKSQDSGVVDGPDVACILMQIWVPKIVASERRESAHTFELSNPGS